MDEKKTPVTFPIDIVYAWADGNDPQYQKLLAQVSRKDMHYARFAESNELFYSLYSIYKFAPWVRKIFIIVADYQNPSLQNLPSSLVNKITLIRQHEIMPGNALPTFNSMAIETVLHLIPDLSEHFIYFNDDTMLGNHVQPTDFFTPNGEGYFFKKWLPRIFFQPIRFLWPEFNYLHQSITLYKQIAQKKKKSAVLWHGLHHCQPCRKSIFEMLWKNPKTKTILNATLHSHLRANHNIQPTALMHLTGLDSGSMLERQMPISSHLFIKLHHYSMFFHIQLLLLKKFKPQFLCFNSELKKPSVLEKQMNQTLLAYFKINTNQANKVNYQND
ncbi:stealth family protein [Legionella fallonii]|uniref:Uncharacterized protein n=1 Tax=Legionella fallonii LLAP-10 TaxID=1212491 RepID=A0A098GAF2_9GAMM|nr:stealth family protein [Legionella fallonii]CEG59000.1 protein of unknown function [Legionella fallonii LLAP-10]